jgi:hypothetical protein
MYDIHPSLVSICPILFILDNLFLDICPDFVAGAAEQSCNCCTKHQTRAITCSLQHTAHLFAVLYYSVLYCIVLLVKSSLIKSSYIHHGCCGN